MAKKEKLNSGNAGISKIETFKFEGPLRLESGQSLGPVTIAYETWGKLNSEKSNAVLIEHAFSGDSHAAGLYEGEKAPGWWDDLIGPGKAFDTEKYFVICSNVLGGCRGTTGPSSIDPSTGKPYGTHFPIVTIGDMVQAQKHLIDHLGIKKLLCVAGGSMGGMQVLEWVSKYPDSVATVRSGNRRPGKSGTRFSVNPLQANLCRHNFLSRIEFSIVRWRPARQSPARLRFRDL